jgi:cytidine deaminase
MKATLTISEFLREHPEVLDHRRVITDEEHFRRWSESRMALVQGAYEAMERAVSWRNFNVGCAVYAWRPYIEADGWLLAEDPADYLGVRWKAFIGANVKPGENIRTTCAEQVAAFAAHMAGYTRIIGMVIVGTPQPDDESGLMRHTLHPCATCRRVLAALPEVRGDTRILTGGLAHDDEGERIDLEEFSFEEILKLHSTERNGRGGI